MSVRVMMVQNCVVTRPMTLGMVFVRGDGHQAFPAVKTTQFCTVKLTTTQNAHHPNDHTNTLLKTKGPVGGGAEGHGRLTQWRSKVGPTCRASGSWGQDLPTQASVGTALTQVCYSTTRALC